jgi:hypothetical protein
LDGEVNVAQRGKTAKILAQHFRFKYWHKLFNSFLLGVVRGRLVAYFY